MYAVVNTIFGIEITGDLAERMSLHVQATSPKDFYGVLGPHRWGLPTLRLGDEAPKEEGPVFLGVLLQRWDWDDVRPLSTIRLAPTDAERRAFEEILEEARAWHPYLKDFDFGEPQVIFWGSSS